MISYILGYLILPLLKKTKLLEPKSEGERPWGKYKILLHHPRYKIKEITVNPGAALSLQMHHHRSEHWVIIEGIAKVTNGDKVSILSENESILIPLGTIHRLENPGKIPLKIIEVQNGSYTEEDDIIRFQDNQRKETK